MTPSHDSRARRAIVTEGFVVVGGKLETGQQLPLQAALKDRSVG
jgi:hypothetical protein